MVAVVTDVAVSVAVEVADLAVAMVAVVVVGATQIGKDFRVRLCWQH